MTLGSSLLGVQRNRNASKVRLPHLSLFVICWLVLFLLRRLTTLYAQFLLPRVLHWSLVFGPPNGRRPSRRRPVTSVSTGFRTLELDPSCTRRPFTRLHKLLSFLVLPCYPTTPFSVRLGSRRFGPSCMYTLHGTSFTYRTRPKTKPTRHHYTTDPPFLRPFLRQKEKIHEISRYYIRVHFKPTIKVPEVTKTRYDRSSTSIVVPK